MAKKQKKSAGEEQGEEGAEPSGGSGGRRKLLILAGAAVILVGGGAGGWFYFARKPAAPQAKVEEKRTVAFVELKEMTVNLAPEPQQERPRFLRLKVALEVKDQKLAAEIQPLLPRVEDAFQVLVRELRMSDLEGSPGTYRLREELLRRVNIAVYPAKVDAVLFKEVIVQ